MLYISIYKLPTTYIYVGSSVTFYRFIILKASTMSNNRKLKVAFHYNVRSAWMEDYLLLSCIPSTIQVKFTLILHNTLLHKSRVTRYTGQMSTHGTVS